MPAQTFKPTETDFATSLRGIVNQAKIMGVPFNEETRQLFIHQAEVKAQDIATIRGLCNILHKPQGGRDMK